MDQESLEKHEAVGVRAEMVPERSCRCHDVQTKSLKRDVFSDCIIHQSAGASSFIMSDNDILKVERLFKETLVLQVVVNSMLT